MRSGALKDLPFLGVGLGYRMPFKTALFQAPETVDFLEIIPEHFWRPTSENARLLSLLARRFPLIPHAIGVSFGSAEGVNPNYLKRIAEIAEQTNAPYWSEHIALTQAGGFDAGHLTPVPRTAAMLDVLSRNIETARKIIKVPLILENITYEIQTPFSEMSEGVFLAELYKRTGVGILLDLTNVFTNASNFQTEPERYINELFSEIPPEAVIQFHLAGGYQNENGKWIDSHSAPVPEAVWTLTQKALMFFPIKGIIIERDSHIPPLAELADEVNRARTLLSVAK